MREQGDDSAQHYPKKAIELCPAALFTVLRTTRWWCVLV
jgi:hypothetical protein